MYGHIILSGNENEAIWNYLVSGNCTDGNSAK